VRSSAQRRGRDTKKSASSKSRNFRSLGRKSIEKKIASAGCEGRKPLLSPYTPPPSPLTTPPSTSSPDRISEIQPGCERRFVHWKPTNGKWDAATMEAKRKFQEAHGRVRRGKAREKTLQPIGARLAHRRVFAPPMPPMSLLLCRKRHPLRRPRPRQRFNPPVLRIALHSKLKIRKLESDIDRTVCAVEW